MRAAQVACLAVLAGTAAWGCAADRDGEGAAGVDGAAAVDAEVLGEYEAQLLDGSTITIREGTGPFAAFTDGRPTEIVALDDLAASGDCDGIIDARSSWTALADDTLDGWYASAYAQHAANLAAVLGCRDAPAADGGRTEISSDDDLWFSSCRALLATGMDGGYVRGVDPEYEWYDEDTDGDGVVCEPDGEG